MSCERQRLLCGLTHTAIGLAARNRALGDGPTQKLFAAILHKPATAAVVLATVQQVARL